jgi:hypothetical protein
LAWGGIGHGQMYREWGFADTGPWCVYGHAAIATNTVGSCRDNEIGRALVTAGITVDANDEAVVTINSRADRRLTARVTFGKWCAELGVVRGA